MGVSILTDENGSIYYCDTKEIPFGKVMKHPLYNNENYHKTIADKVLNSVEEEYGHRDPRRIKTKDLIELQETVEKDVSLE